ncbi:uncharacterized protein TNCV_4573561 [Trichonephila clavipes]|nr:uncharacterized protein TNCV_4573561 [Trichonephila clavipes]
MANIRSFMKVINNSCELRVPASKTYKGVRPPNITPPHTRIPLPPDLVAAVTEWSRYRIVAGLVTSSSPVPLKSRRVGQRCTLNLSRAQTSSRWCGVVVRRGASSSGVVHVT